MTNSTTFAYDKNIDAAEIAGTLKLAVIAAASLHGPERVELQASYHHEPAERTVTIDASTDVGIDLGVLFFGLARREFGERNVRVIPQAENGGRP